ncbi:rod shape-determining protein RodA [Microvirgula aerodenitrificans]|uniref:rod shape-determining protein RodA n=1 Tax=Microvirgula aerodenitrificans TaxID=57480 RepID=UPI00048A8060|nr:rod shape-determining protein RodA [Microvirgula aerodenitrificans]
MSQSSNLIGRIFERIKAPVDGWLFLFTILIFIVSLVVLYSASNQNLDKVLNKMAFMAIALGVMWAIANIKPEQLMQLALPGYLIGVLLLVGVALFGEVVNGSRRWLDIGVTRIQPSEILKIMVPMVLAWFFQKNESSLRWFHFVIGALVIAVPVAFVLKQPDLGTASLIAAAGFYVIFLAGLPWRVLLIGLLGFGATLPVIWNMMHDYQRQRVLTLLDPTQDPLGAGYHIIQSMIAIGSGGPLGKGWLAGTQTHLEFIPERTTDFIFAVYAEEFGLLGNGILLVLYLLVIGRGLMIAAKSTNLFGRLMAGSLTLSFFTYAFVNMGMVSGILPVVGVPLPLVSYGGTAMVSILVGFGMLMSIQKHRPLIKR